MIQDLTTGPPFLARIENPKVEFTLGIKGFPSPLSKNDFIILKISSAFNPDPPATGPELPPDYYYLAYFSFYLS